LDILDIIRTRRSIRKFSTGSVDDALIEMILEAGRWAPSGMNNQPWRFAVVKDKEMKELLTGLTHYSTIVKSAGVLIPVFLNNGESYNRIKDVQAIGACLQNMLLEAHSLGLGAVWLGEIIKNGEQIRELLGADRDLELMAVLAVGHPSENPKTMKRKDLDDLIVFRK